MDLMSVCRTCMSSTSLNPIFPLPEVHERFSNAIYLITGIKVSLNDGLPQKMCIECLKQVNETMKFRAKCKEIEENLLTIKNEVRRAVRHNESIVNYRSDASNDKYIIREIKVGNRWIKIDSTNNLTHDDNDEPPVMHLLNTETNDIQNIYITDETGEQMIPLEMVKVEEDPRNDDVIHCNDDTTDEPEDSNVTGLDYDVDTVQDAIEEQEETVLDEEALDDEDGNNIVNIANELEETEENPDDTLDDEEYTIISVQEDVSDQEDTTNEVEAGANDAHINDEPSDVISKQEHAENVQDGNFNDPEDQDTLKTYYIFKEEDSSPDNVEMIKTETDHTDDIEFDNINVSENQDIVVMDNRESLYVIDMSNPSSKRVTCKLCQKNLSIRSIDLHLSKSHPGADGRRIKCQLCDNFVIREKMVQHRLVMHGAEAYQCRYCKWEFEKEDALIDHVVTCTAKKKRKACDSGREMVECEVCHKKMQKASLRLHTAMTHAGLRPVCDHCGKSFGNKFRLNEHYRAKHGYEKFKCSDCDFQSASSLALRNHERRHRGEKPYICERCGAKFHAAYLLTQHKHSHRTERKFKCELCAMCFKTNNGLHSHRRSCHDGVRRLRSGRARDVTDTASEINDE